MKERLESIYLRDIKKKENKQKGKISMNGELYIFQRSRSLTNFGRSSIASTP